MKTIKKKTRRVFVTDALLKKLGACAEERRMFRRTFGKRAELCTETLRLWDDLNGSVFWLGRELSYRLSTRAQAIFNVAVNIFISAPAGKRHIKLARHLLPVTRRALIAYRASGRKAVL